MTTSSGGAGPAALPPELLSKRDELITALEKTAKTAVHPSLQQVLQKMLLLMRSTKPGSPALNPDAFRQIQEAFLLFAEDPAAPRSPEILLESMEWMDRFIRATVALLPKGVQAEMMSDVPPMGTKGAFGARRGKDSFESVAPAARARSLTEEGIPQVVPPAPPDKPRPQVEPFKAWMKNPGLGKLKG